MLNKEPTTFEEALLLLNEVVEENRKMLLQIKQLKDSLAEKETIITAAEKKVTKLYNDNNALTLLKEHFQSLFNALNKEKYGSRTEKYLKLAKSQPFLFSNEEMKIKISDILRVQKDETKEEEEKEDDAKNKKSGPQPDEEVTYEIFDPSIDDTLNDEEYDDKYDYEEIKTYLDLDEEDKFCDKCGKPLKFAYVKSRSRFVLIPAKLIRQRIIYKVYECKDCIDENGTDGASLKKSSNIKEIIPGGIASPSLLANILGAKFINHTTFHTKSQAMNWEHMPISKQNMCHWQQQAHKVLKPLENLFLEETKKSEFLNCDETPIKVQKCKKKDIEKEYWPNTSPPKEPKDDKIRECRIWVVSGFVDGHWIKNYKFRYSRSGTFMLPYLEDCPNLKCIQSDRFGGYKTAIEFHNYADPSHPISWNLCNIHSRRKFVECFERFNSPLAVDVLIIYKSIFHEDKELRNKYKEGLITEEEFLKLREKNIKPLFEQLYSLLKPYSGKGKVANPKLKEAVNYFIDNYDELIGFLKYPFLTPSNNSAEIMCKQAVLIRKNSLLCGSPEGARSACFILTLVQTCIANKINPIEYLRCLFEQAPYAETKEDWIKLLPWNIELTPLKLSGEWVSKELEDIKTAS